MLAICGKCPARWTGTNMAHCSVCHSTFSTVANFDSHRDGSIGRVRCSTTGLVQNSYGTWKQPGEWDVTEAKNGN